MCVSNRVSSRDKVRGQPPALREYEGITLRRFIVGHYNLYRVKGGAKEAISQIEKIERLQSKTVKVKSRADVGCLIWIP